MMFINSIFLPKTLSDQPMADGMTQSAGSFSHLFANVFRIIKDGQENSDPIQLFQTTELSAPNLQNELLKVSLSADNKIVKENSSISMIVSLFVSQFRPGETVPQTVDNNKIKASENAPKYFSLSKNDLTKEIKNLLDSLEDLNVSQSGSAEISLLVNGITNPIHFDNNSSGDIENLIASQVSNKNDFKLSVKIGNQTLTLDVEAIKQGKTEPYLPVEILNDDEKTAVKSSNNVTSADQIKVTSKENHQETISAFQPQFKGMKPSFNHSDNTILSKTQVETNPLEQQIVNKQLTDLKVNQTNNPAPVAEKIKSEQLIPELEKQTSKTEPVFKTINPTKSISEVPIQKLESEKVQTTEANHTDKKISFKSNQKLNSVFLNKVSTDEKVKLNDLAEKTEVKEIKVDVQNFAKNNSPVQNLKSDVKQDNVLLTPDIEKQLKTSVKPAVHNPNEELKSDKQVVENKTIELKPNTTNNETVKKVVQNFPNEEIKNTSVNTFKHNPETTKFEQQELFTEDIAAQTNKGTTNTTEIKTEIKSVTSDWFKSKVTEEQKPLVKENNIKTLNKVEAENEIVNETEFKIAQEKSGKEEAAKVITEQKPQSKLSTFNTAAEKVLNPQKELTQNETIEKTIKTPVEQIKLKSETIVKESAKPFQAVDNKPEEVSTDSKSLKTETGLINEKKPASIEVKNVYETRETEAVKVNYKERRVYSQIPKLEVIVDDKPIKNSDTKIISSEPTADNKTKLVEEPVKSASNVQELKVKEEKQVWVKVSVEKADVENQEQIRKSSSISKITAKFSDETNKDLSSGNYSQDDSKDQLKQKPQSASLESSQNSDTKTSIQTQNGNNQHEVVNSIKPEHKTEQAQFRSELNNENLKYNSRTTEMVEKVKVISSGEMVREVYKVLENGEKQSIVLKLVPKELGAIKVMLDTVDNVLTAKVEVENETVGQVIRNNVEQLKQNLLQSGVHVNSINISYSSSQQKQHGFNNQKKKNSGYQQDNNLEEVDEAIITKKLGYNTYEYLA